MITVATLVASASARSGTFSSTSARRSASVRPAQQRPDVQQQQHHRQRHHHRLRHQRQGEERHDTRRTAATTAAARSRRTRAIVSSQKKRAQHVLPLRDPRDRLHVQRMRGEDRRDERAPARRRRSSAGSSSNSSSVLRDVQDEIDDVVRAGDPCRRALTSSRCDSHVIGCQYGECPVVSAHHALLQLRPRERSGSR